MADALSILLLAHNPEHAIALSEQFALDPTLQVHQASRPVMFARPLDSERVDIAVIVGPAKDAIVELRAAAFRGPVLVLTDEADPIDRLDTIILPSRFSFILSRVRSAVRSFEAREEPWVTIGGFRLMLGSKMLVDQDGNAEKLTDKETDILRFMHRAGAELVAREVLLTEIWGYNEKVSTHTLETHIYRLRQKIERDPANAELLVTEAGGYRLAELPKKDHANGA
jgi:DNA-binding response OmpR family regulator